MYIYIRMIMDLDYILYIYIREVYHQRLPPVWRSRTKILSIMCRDYTNERTKKKVIRKKYIYPVYIFIFAYKMYVCTVCIHEI